MYILYTVYYIICIYYIQYTIFCRIQLRRVKRGELFLWRWLRWVDRPRRGLWKEVGG